MRTILGGEGESTYDCNAIASNNPQRKQCAMDIRVAVIPCVGDESYARRQMMSLTTDIFGTENGTEERTTQNEQIPARRFILLWTDQRRRSKKLLSIRRASC